MVVGQLATRGQADARELAGERVERHAHARVFAVAAAGERNLAVRRSVPQRGRIDRVRGCRPFPGDTSARHADDTADGDVPRRRRDGDRHLHGAQHAGGAHVAVPVAARLQLARELLHLRAVGVAADVKRFQLGAVSAVHELAVDVGTGDDRLEHPRLEAAQRDRAPIARAAGAGLEPQRSANAPHPALLRWWIVANLDVGARAANRHLQRLTARRLLRRLPDQRDQVEAAAAQRTAVHHRAVERELVDGERVSRERE